MVANWFVGYTPEIVTVAMIAKDTNPYYAGYWAKHPNNLYGLRLDSGTYLAGTGSSTVAPYLWRPAMIAAVKDLPKTAFSSPPSSILHGKKMAMPKVTNTDPDADKATLEKAGFTVLTKDIYSDTVEAGGYISATCDGTVAGTCWLQYSKGPRPGSTPSASAPPVVNNPGSTQTTNKPQEPGAHETPN